jgi:hypothetical protein
VSLARVAVPDAGREANHRSGDVRAAAVRGTGAQRDDRAEARIGGHV